MLIEASFQSDRNGQTEKKEKNNVILNEMKKKKRCHSE